jgi:D-aminoacyl-tRNA deacylase
MRTVLQRVCSASVSVSDRVVARIGAGLVALIGVAADDSQTDSAYTAAKIRDVRIFADAQGRMNQAIGESGGAVLAVPQFTLLGDVRKGRRPAFDGAAPPEAARVLYEDVVARLRAGGLDVQTGVFQTHMRVELVNDGPVTILLDSRRLF